MIFILYVNKKKVYIKEICYEEKKVILKSL